MFQMFQLRCRGFFVFDSKSVSNIVRYYGHSYGYHSYDPHPPGYSGPTGGGEQLGPEEFGKDLAAFCHGINWG